GRCQRHGRDGTGQRPADAHRRAVGLPAAVGGPAAGPGLAGVSAPPGLRGAPMRTILPSFEESRMKSLYLNGARALSIAVLSLGLIACGGEQEVAKTFDPVAFHSDDECHVCGMILEEHAGPKGQVVGEREVRKFCSVAEMFGWY